METQLFAISQGDADVVVLFPLIRRIDHAQAAGHAEVDEERGAVVDFQQQILRAPGDAADRATFDFQDVFRNRLAQIVAADDHLCDPRSCHIRLDAAAGGFDFGELGHVASEPAQGALSRRGRIGGF